MCQETLKEIRSAVEKTGDKELLAVTEQMESKRKERRPPLVLLVSSVYGREDVLRALGKLLGDMDRIRETLPGGGRPFLLEILGEGEENGRTWDVPDFERIRFRLPGKAMQGMEFAYWCGLDQKRPEPDIAEDADFLILVTDCIMVLPQKEKDWLKESVLPHIGGERTFVSISRKELLNTQEERETLSRAAKGLLSGMNDKIRFYEELEELIGRLPGLCSDIEEIERLRKRWLIKNGVQRLSGQVEERLKMAESDVEALKENIKRMETERGSIESCGRLVIDGLIENRHTELKNHLLNAADQYGDEAYTSIRERLEKTEDVEADVKNIQPYLESVWKIFEKKAGEWIAKEQLDMTEELEEQIRKDCHAILSLSGIPEEAAKAAVQNGKKTFIQSEEEKRAPGWLRKNGVLIASLAIAFVNPVWGLAAFVGLNIVQKNHKKAAEDLRSQVLGSLYGECTEVKRRIMEELSRGIEKAEEESKANIQKIYGEILDSMEAAILEAAKRIEESAKKREVFALLLTELERAKGQEN